MSGLFFISAMVPGTHLHEVMTTIERCKGSAITARPYGGTEAGAKPNGHGKRSKILYDVAQPDFIRDYAEKHPEFTAEEFAKVWAKTNYPPKSVYPALTSAIKHGLIKKVARGSYKRVSK